MSSIIQKCWFNPVGINCGFNISALPRSTIALAVLTFGSPF